VAKLAENQLRALDFKRGINNIAGETDLKGNEVREAVNVDIDPAGGLQRRGGYTLKLSGDCHSVWASKERVYVVQDGDLMSYAVVNKELVDAAMLRSGLSEAPLSYAEAHGDIYWSNGILARRISDDVDLPFWIETPVSPTVTAVAYGGLTAGRYQLVITMVGSTGIESGAPVASVVDVPEGGGVMLSEIALSEGAHHARAYMTEPDGDVLFYRTEVPAAATSGSLSVSDGPGRPLRTQFLQPMPAGQIVRFWSGRLLVASGDTLYFGEPNRGGLYKRDNYFRFAGRITLLEAVGEGEEGAGVYLSDGKRVYFLSGPNPKEWARRVRFMHPAVEGSGIVVPGSYFADETEQTYTGPVAVWVSQNGTYCLGLPGGVVRTIREDSVALPRFDRAAMMLREQGGKRQIVGSFSGGESNPMAMSDSMSAVVRRHGKILD
jgi:hypothetical protein